MELQLLLWYNIYLELSSLMQLAANHVLYISTQISSDSNLIVKKTTNYEIPLLALILLKGLFSIAITFVEINTTETRCSNTLILPNLYELNFQNKVSVAFQ